MFGQNNQSTIVDKRSNFKINTFSGYKRTQVFKQLEKNIFNGCLEEACHWSTELVISGYYCELIELFSIIYSKFVNINNPNFPIFLYEAIILLINTLKSDIYKKNFLELRNNQQVRFLICKITTYLCLSNKVSCFNLYSLSLQDFKEEYLQSKIIPTKNYLKLISKPDDPQNLIIIGNQLVQEVINKNINKAIYWISWILQWDKINIKENRKINCHKRSFPNIDIKFNDDFIWFIWEIIINLTNEKNNKNNILALLYLFAYDFTKSKKITKINLLINALLILIENPDYNIPITRDNHFSTNAIQNINFLYSEINKNYVPVSNNNINCTTSNNSLDYIIKEEKKPKKKNKEDDEEYLNSVEKLKKVDQLYNNFLI